MQRPRRKPRPLLSAVAVVRRDNVGMGDSVPLLFVTTCMCIARAGTLTRKTAAEMGKDFVSGEKALKSVRSVTHVAGGHPCWY